MKTVHDFELPPELLKQAMANMVNGLTIADATQPDLPLVYVNPGFTQMTGYRPDEVIGQNCRFLQGDDHDQPDLAELRAALREGRACTVTLRNYRKDGTLFWNELSLSPLHDAQGQLTHFVGIQQDITPRKRLEQQIQDTLERREHEAYTAIEVAQEIAAAPALDELFRQVVELIQDRFGYYHAHLYTVAGDDLVMQEGTGEAGRQMKAAGHKIALAAEKSLVARAAREGQPVLIADVAQVPDWLPNALLPETRSELAVPIMLRDQVLGVLDVQSNTIGGLSDEDQLLLVGLCGQIAIAIDHRWTEMERQQAEDARRESEARLAEALEVAQLGHWELDVTTLMFTCNDQFYALMGTTAEQEGGYQMPAARYAEKFLPPEEMHVVAEGTQEAIETTDPNYQRQIEHRIIRGDGTEGYLQVRVRIVKDEQGQTIRIYGANQDITERKLAELEREQLLAEVQESERLTRTIIDSTPDWIFIKDQDHLYRMVNQGYANSMHMEPDEFVGKNDLEVGFPEAIVKGDPAQGIRGFWADDRQVMDSGETRFVPAEPAVVDGEPRTLSTIKVPLRDDSGAVWGVLGYVRDITENMRVQAQLETSQTQLSEALDIAQMAYWELDLASLKLILNDTFYAILGTTAEEEGAHWIAADDYARRFVHPDDAYIITTEIEKAIAATDPSYSNQVEYRLIRANGEERYVFVKFRIAKNDQGQTVKMYGMLQDITERRQTEEALAQSLAETEEQTQRLSHLNQMGTVLQAVTTLDEIFQIASRQTPQIIAGDRASVALLAPSGDHLEILALSGVKGAIPTGAHLPVEGTMIGQCLTENRLMAISNDDMNWDNYLETRQLSEQGIQSTMVAPLVASGRIIGTLNMASKTPHAFPAPEQRLMLQIVAMLASAINNHRLLEQLQTRASELEIVADVSTTVTRTLDPQHLLQEVVDLTKASFNLYHAHIYLLDKEQMLVLTAGADEVGRRMVAEGRMIPLDQEQSLVARAARTRHGVIVNDVQADPGFLPNPLLPNTHSEMAVPLIAGESVLGVLDVQAETVNHFNEEDVQVQTILASQIAVALRNANLYQQMQESLAETKQSQELLRITIDATPDWIFVKDREHRFQLVNQGFADSKEMLPEEIIGKNDLELDLPEEILKGNPAKGISGFWSDDDEVMATGKVKVIDVESRILHGQPIFLSTIKVPLRDANGEIWGVLGYARDITEREQLLHQAERLYKANQRINEAQDLQEVIAAIAEALDIHAFNRMILIIFEYNTTDELTGVSVAANWHSGEGKLPTSIGTRYSRQDLTSLDVFLSAEPLFFDDAQQDERFDGTTKEILKALSIQSLAVLPLWTGGRQLGSFVMEAEERHHFTEREIQPCLALASQAAVAVDNQRLLEETRAALAEVEATQRLYTIQAWETYRTRTATRSYERNQPGIEPLGDNLPPEVSQAVANRQVVATSGLVDHQQNGDQSLAKEAGSNLIVPLTIRNEIIGVLGLQDLDQTRHWSPEEIALVQAIGDQLAQAAENLRLIDATQQRAAREQRVNEIGEKIQAAQSLEEALQVAVKEVGLSLNAPQSRVQLSIKYIENDKDYQGEGFLR